MPIFRRKDCIHTASGIFALCKRLHSTLVESGLKLVNEIILCYDARSKKHQIHILITFNVKWEIWTVSLGEELYKTGFWIFVKNKQQRDVNIT
jgi:hypothetical protein